MTKADFIKAGTEYDEYNMLQDWGMVSERGKSDRADQREGGTDRQRLPFVLCKPNTSRCVLKPSLTPSSLLLCSSRS